MKQIDESIRCSQTFLMFSRRTIDCGPSARARRHFLTKRKTFPDSFRHFYRYSTKEFVSPPVEPIPERAELPFVNLL